jgi:hypothetical protein
MPRMSSGVVSRRTRMQGSSRDAAACAAREVKTIRPVAAPGLAAMPRAQMSRARADRPAGAEAPTSPAAPPAAPPPPRDDPVRASDTAIRTSARELRCTRTASRMRSAPASSVNSICISSRSRVRQRSPRRRSSAKTSGCVLLERRPPRIAGEIDHPLPRRHRVAPLALRQVAPRHLRLARWCHRRTGSRPTPTPGPQAPAPSPARQARGPHRPARPSPAAEAAPRCPPRPAPSTAAHPRAAARGPAETARPSRPRSGEQRATGSAASGTSKASGSSRATWIA